MGEVASTDLEISDICCESCRQKLNGVFLLQLTIQTSHNSLQLIPAGGSI